MLDDQTIEVAVRRARMDAARSSSAVIAAMAAGSGAELVARQQLSREILEQRLREARRPGIVILDGSAAR